jgi:hypothetical protein
MQKASEEKQLIFFDNSVCKKACLGHGPCARVCAWCGYIVRPQVKFRALGFSLVPVAMGAFPFRLWSFAKF